VKEFRRGSPRLLGSGALLRSSLSAPPAAVLASAAVAEHRESEIPEPTAPAVDSRPLPVLPPFSLQLATAHRLRTQPTRVGLEGAGRSIHPGRRKHATAGSARSEPRMVSRAQRGERRRATWGFHSTNPLFDRHAKFLNNFPEVLQSLVADLDLLFILQIVRVLGKTIMI
jgi:hypothetical protein